MAAGHSPIVYAFAMLRRMSGNRIAANIAKLPVLIPK
jgi:hypothetical protein